MELTYHTDYALRVLLYAGANSDRRVTLKEIAGAYGLSKEPLRKVVHQLGLRGFISTVQGRSGGLVLGRPAAAIRVGEVVEAMEESLCIVNCNRQPCRLAGHCSLRSAFDRARDAFLRELNAVTLADLLDENATSARLHALSASA